ncbi:MAG: hypothetical protein B6D73_18260 [gamma proteobacterium symbiont of Stewartia floridana]|nr:MAG: hypothetical protein B6D73_18260 [gamma proteobacterium symbiont of Stewartia floridana]
MKFIVMAIALLPTLSHSSDCSEKLLDKEFRTGSSASDKYEYDFHLACSSNFKEYGKSKGGDAEFAFKLISGGASYNENNYNQFKAKSCNESTQERHRKAMEYYAFEVFNKDAVNAYLQCKRHQGFSCWVQPHGLSQIKFIAHLGTGAPRYETPDGIIINGNVQIIGNKLSAGSVLKYGPQSVVVERNDAGPVFFSLDVSTEITTNSCEAFVPGNRTYKGPLSWTHVERKGETRIFHKPTRYGVMLKDKESTFDRFCTELGMRFTGDYRQEKTGKDLSESWGYMEESGNWEKHRCDYKSSTWDNCYVKPVRISCTRISY